ncbi:hypothetical protein PIB30_072530, partial [Stylosanthes scabra]|nr:hypothetical protein [Stylosanthes scabra]
LTLDMSAETSWKYNTENLREVPRICVEAYAYAWKPTHMRGQAIQQHPESCPELMFMRGTLRLGVAKLPPAPRTQV